MPLTRDQIALLHVATKKLALSDESYRDILERVAGVRSARDLAATGFEAVMVEFERLGFVSTANARAGGSRRHWEKATPGQVHGLRKRWRESGYGGGDERALDRWIEKHFGVSSVRFLTREQAKKALTALNAMLARQARQAAGDGASGAA